MAIIKYQYLPSGNIRSMHRYSGNSYLSYAQISKVPTQTY